LNKASPQDGLNSFSLFQVEYEAISKETVCQVSAKVRPSRVYLLVVQKELLIQKESI